MPPKVSYTKDSTKKCKACGETKSIDEFHKVSSTLADGSKSQGRHPKCKLCDIEYTKEWRKKNPDKAKQQWRRAHLKYDYGLSQEQYNQMLQTQNGGCAICGGISNAGRTLAVDHCHDTSVIRGLLCDSCNNGIGRFKHDQDLLRSAIKYLDENRSGNAVVYEHDNKLPNQETPERQG